MTAKNNNKINSNGRKSFRFIGAAVLIVAIILVVVWLKVVRGSENPTNNMATFVAMRGPLTISVLESGTIKAREQIIIKNEVEGRTSIITLIPEGTRVKKGDLLVELDASSLEDNKIDQEIRVQNAEASYINAQENLAVVKNQAESDIDVAKLTLEFAREDLKQYKEGEYPNELAAAQNKITLAQEELTRAQETLEWSQKLYEEKYIAQTELEGDRLSKKRREVDLELAKNDLDLLENFTYGRNIAQLESDVRQAEMALERTERKASANVVQATADLKAKEAEFKRQKDKLAKLEDQIGKAKIYAPADGMVIYATSAQRGGWRDSRTPLDEGVEVFERQELIYLPTATSSMAEVDIHEASLEKVRVGLPAIITVDALPGKKFLGTVERIAPLPDPQSMWMNPDLKVYNSDVYLEGDDPSLRTGMSCKVEIIVEQYKDTVYVPVQAVLRIGTGHVVYVVKNGSTEERKVEIGLDNNRMVRIISGLEEGEVVLLTPPLKAATIEQGSQMSGTGSLNSSDVSETLKQGINQRLEQANGTKTDGSAAPDDSTSRQPFQQGQTDREAPSSGASSDQMERMRQRFQNMSPEERQKEMERMKQRFENMSPEERQKEMERMKQRFENMSPEDRQRMGQRFQGGPGGEGRRPREQSPEESQ
jgi:HlyD family secretion protein